MPYSTGFVEGASSAFILGANVKKSVF